jgi:two-component system, OmpR family, sensor kinase
MFNSIRWTLQLWYAGILFLALLGVGTVLYLSAERTTYTEIDTALRGAARVFTGAASGSTAPADRSSSVQLALAPQPTDANPSRVVSDAAPSMVDLGAPPMHSKGHANAAWLKNVPQDCLVRLGWDPSQNPYFLVWGSDGAILKQSSQAPQISRVSLASFEDKPAAEPAFENRGEVREILAAGPDGSTILIGRSIQRELAGLANLRLSLLTGGAMIMLVGVAGGFALTRRALSPIASMSDAARAISGSDLSSRIDERRIKSELGPLAKTLNGTFDRLEGAFQRQAQFTADASHELRTPLAVILSSSELALSRPRGTEEYRVALESNLRASKRMSSLVESLLVLARADADALVLNYAPFDLRQAADDCVDLLLPVAMRRKVSLEAGGDAVEIEADRGRILQLITNLLGNAIQYNREGGSVKITVARDESHATITVADTGIGIPPADQARIFQRFFRVDKARSRESGGCGLGLAICQSIINAHGGSVSFSSTPDLGTTFVVRIPISKGKDE